MYGYSFTPHAFKQLKKLAKNMQKRIIKKLDFFCKEDPLGFAERLTDTHIGTYRFRIGSYRVIFDLNEKNLIILALGDRKEIYK